MHRELEVTDVAPTSWEEHQSPLSLSWPHHLQDLLVPNGGTWLTLDFSAMFRLGSFLWITHHPSRWMRVRISWEVDALAQDRCYNNKSSRARADKVFPSWWELTVSTLFVRSKLCKAVVLGCRCRTSSLIFKGAKHLQNPLVLTA